MHYVCINDEIDEFVTRVMISMGILPSLNGYAYLKRAIEIFVKNDCNMNEICSTIACEEKVSRSSVERDMRTALNVSHTRELHDRINDFAGVVIVNGNEKLSVKEYVAIMGEIICYTFKVKTDDIFLTDKDGQKE